MSLSIFPTLPGLTYTIVKTPEFNTLDMKGPNGYEVRIAQTINPIWHYVFIFDFLHDFYWGQYVALSELRTLMGFYLQQQGMAGSFLYLDPDDSSVGPALSTSKWQALSIFPLGFGILDVANHWQKVTSITTGLTGSTIPTFNDTGGTTSDAGVTWTDQGLYSSSGFPNAPLAQLQLVSDSAGNWYSPIQSTMNGVFYEDVTDLNGGISVYINGSVASPGTAPNQYEIFGPGLALPTASYMGMYLKWGVIAPAWQASHAYALNAEILDPAGHIQKATTAGTSGTTIPVFNDLGSTTPDGTGSLVWTDQGAYLGPTAPITAAFNYYHRVRFESDSQDFEKFCGTGSASGFAPAGQGAGIYTIGGENAQNGSGTLKLCTARPVAL